MNSRVIEIMVGVFMALFFLAIFILALRVSNLNNLGGGDGYKVHARFENIGGLKVRSAVSAGGVKIGKVSDISYDLETFQAKVTLSIDEAYNSFPTDTSASIYTAGLLGEQYIGLDPGAEEEFLTNGSEITLTQSAVVLEKLISQFLFSKSGSQSD